jgi:hypothetical protein
MEGRTIKRSVILERQFLEPTYGLVASIVEGGRFVSLKMNMEKEEIKKKGIK